MAALTHAIQTLTTCQQEGQAQLQETLQDLPHRIRNEWQASHRDITTPTQDFSGLIKESQAPESEDKTFEPRPLLWKAPTYPRDSSGPNLLARITAWPNRPQPPAQRRTG